MICKSLRAPILAAAAALAFTAAASAQSRDPALAALAEDFAVEAYSAFSVSRYADALKAAEEAAALGSPEGMLLAARIHERALLSDASDAEAVRWFRAAHAAAATGEAALALALLARDGRGGLGPADAGSWFGLATAAAGQVGVDARHEFALFLLSPEAGVHADAARGRALLAQTAGEGSVAAQRDLGLALVDADAAERDVVQGARWLDIAASGGDLRAAYAAGILYADGDGVQADPERAVRLLRQAADAGLAPAMADLGLLTYQGRGTVQSFTAAADLFRRAAEGGDPSGRFLYAFVLARGEGIERDLEAAYGWALRAGQGVAPEAADPQLPELIARLEQVLPAQTVAAIRSDILAPATMRLRQ